MIYHNVIINVQDNANNCFIDVYQNDGNSHCIMFKLMDGDTFFNLSQYSPEIIYYDEDTKNTIISTSVNIVNAYRGYISWVIGNSLLKDIGRRVITLNLKVDYSKNCSNPDIIFSSELSFNVIVNVLKRINYIEPESEVAITKEFYDNICSHLDNRLIHLSETDREVLNKLSEMINYIVVNHPESDEDVVKILSQREDFVQLVLDIAKTDPKVIERLIEDVDNLKVNVSDIINELGELVRTPEGEEPVTNIHDFVETYPKWVVFGNISNSDDDGD